MHSNGIDGIVNPESNQESGNEKVGGGSNGRDNTGGPRSEKVAAGAEGDHPGDGAVDGADERVGAREHFVDEETNYSCRAASHLVNFVQILSSQDLPTCVLTTALEKASPSPALLMDP